MHSNMISTTNNRAITRTRTTIRHGGSPTNNPLKHHTWNSTELDYMLKGGQSPSFKAISREKSNQIANTTANNPPVGIYHPKFPYLYKYSSPLLLSQEHSHSPPYLSPSYPGKAEGEGEGKEKGRRGEKKDRAVSVSVEGISR